MNNAATKIQRAVRSHLNKVTWHPMRVHTGRNLAFNNAIRNRTVGKRLGDRSAFGEVHELGSSLKYVVKRMKVDTPSLKKIFYNELRVGSTPGISKVGPRIYAWRIKGGYGEYIMDNFVRGDRSLTVTTFHEYMWKHFAKKCPPKSHVVWGRLRTLLKNFWVVTKGYHGDLHTNNIVVLTKPDGSIERMMIFDYGSHKKFKASVNTTMCFDDLVMLIQAEFQRSNLKSEYELNQLPNGTGIKMYEPKTGQPRRGNVPMLMGINYLGKPIRYNSQTYNDTPMTRMRTGPRNLIAEVQSRKPGKSREQIREILATFAKNTPNAHRKYFMSRANFNKVLAA